jgi:hypothetical protein
MNLRQAAQTALDVQNACNLSGVVRSFVEATDAIRESGEYSGTKSVNVHPITTLFISKLASLNNTDCFCSQCIDTFAKARKACEALANQQGGQR